MFMVDEIDTGCGATGTMWAHEEWKLQYNELTKQIEMRQMSSSSAKKRRFLGYL